MRQEVAEAGGRIDAIYYCPHDWDAGLHCRKPSQACSTGRSGTSHLDLTRTPFVGDDERDATAAADGRSARSSVTSERRLLDITRTADEHEGSAGSCLTKAHPDHRQRRLYRLGDGAVASGAKATTSSVLIPATSPSARLSRPRPISRRQARHPRCHGGDLGGYDAIIHLAALSNDPIGNLNDSLDA